MAEGDEVGEGDDVGEGDEVGEFVADDTAIIEWRKGIMSQKKMNLRDFRVLLKETVIMKRYEWHAWQFSIFLIEWTQSDLSLMKNGDTAALRKKNTDTHISLSHWRYSWRNGAKEILTTESFTFSIISPLSLTGISKTKIPFVAEEIVEKMKRDWIS